MQVKILRDIIAYRKLVSCCIATVSGATPATEVNIALATINRADLLVSWNFKHIVNVKRIRGYNSINIKLGYSQLEIRSPRELMNYESEN